jgi:hypothetical protein
MHTIKRNIWTASRASLALALGMGFASAGSIATAAAADVRCTNQIDGYSLRVPDGWYYNERVEGGEAEDIAACRFLSPSDFEIRPATDANGIAISIGREGTPPRAEGSDTTVGGLPATIIETVAGDDGFEPAGTRHYQYWIDTGDDWLVADTSDAPNYVGDYDANKATLDMVMDGLTFTAAKLPDTSTATQDGSWLALIAGAGLLALAFRRTAGQQAAAPSAAGNGDVPRQGSVS